MPTKPTDIQIAESASEVALPEATHTQTNLKPVKQLTPGGLGDIFIFKDALLNRLVAVKTPRRELVNSPGVLERFRREYEITSALNITFVPDVHYGGELSDGRPFFAMRFIDGLNFKELIRKTHREGIVFRRSDLELVALLEKFISVCRTMAAAHRAGFVHRDLKPSNVLIDRDGHAYVIDWGLATKLDQGCHLVSVDGQSQLPRESKSTDGSTQATPAAVTAIGLANAASDSRAMGSPAYMSPEQASSLPTANGNHSDIYCLGGILFEILTAMAPHKRLLEELEQQQREAAHSSPVGSQAGDGLTSRTHGGDGQTIVDRDGHLKSIAAARPVARLQKAGIPAELSAIAEKAMSRDVNQRYANADEIATEIQRWLFGNRVNAHRYSLFSAAAKKAAKFPRFALAATLVFIAFVIVLAGYGKRENRLRRTAEANAAVATHTVASNLRTLEQVLNCTSDQSRDDSPAIRKLREEIMGTISQSLFDWDMAKLGPAARHQIASLSWRLGLLYMDEEQLPLAIELFQQGHKLAAENRAGKLASADSAMLEFELLNGLTQAFSKAHRVNEALDAGESLIRIADVLANDFPTRESVLHLPITARRTHAFIAYDGWNRSLLVAHERAFEALTLCKSLRQKRDTPELKLEHAKLLLDLGLYTHKAGGCADEMNAFYAKHAGCHDPNTVLSQGYFDESGRLLAECITGGCSNEILVTKVEHSIRKGMSDLKLQIKAETGDDIRAYQTYRVGIEIAEQLLQREPLNRRYVVLLARVLNNHADASLCFGDRDQERLFRERALKLLENVMHSGSLQSKLVCGTCTVRLAQNYISSGETALALKVTRSLWDRTHSLHSEAAIEEFLCCGLVYDDCVSQHNVADAQEIIEQSMLLLARPGIDPNLVLRFANEDPQCATLLKNECFGVVGNVRDLTVDSLSAAKR